MSTDGYSPDLDVVFSSCNGLYSDPVPPEKWEEFRKLNSSFRVLPMSGLTSRIMVSTRHLDQCGTLSLPVCNDLNIFTTYKPEQILFIILGCTQRVWDENWYIKWTNDDIVDACIGVGDVIVSIKTTVNPDNVTNIKMGLSGPFEEIYNLLESWDYNWKAVVECTVCKKLFFLPGLPKSHLSKMLGSEGGCAPVPDLSSPLSEPASYPACTLL